MDKQLFDDAIGEVPPSTVDVEAVIARGRRAARLHRVTNPAVAAGVAVVLLTGAVAYTMTRDTGGGATVGTAPPTSTTSSQASSPATPPSTAQPTGPDGQEQVDMTTIDDGRTMVPPPQCAEDDLESATDAAARLREAATDAVLGQRPDLRLEPNLDYPKGTPRGPLEFYQIVDPGQELSICDPQGRFESTATTKAPDGDGNLLVLVSPDLYPDEQISCEQNGLPGATFCTAETGQDGEEIVKQAVGFEGGTVMHRVEVVREDGTSLLVQAENVTKSSKYGGSATAAAPPLTIDQLVTIALDPDLTIFK